MHRTAPFHLAALLLQSCLFAPIPNPTPVLKAPAEHGVRLEVTTAGGQTTFRQGELVELSLAFSTDRLDTYRVHMGMYDRVGRLHSDDYAVEPAEGAVDPLSDYFSEGILSLGGIRSMPPLLTAEPTLIVRELNEYLRFDQPGSYSLRVTSSRVGNNDGTVLVTSSPLVLKIVAADRTWADVTLDASRRTLLDESVSDDERRAAARVLRFLTSEEAARAMVQVLPRLDRRVARELFFGLIGSRHRALVLSEMERARLDPDVPITPTFFDTLAYLRAGGSPTRSDGALAEEVAVGLDTKRGDARAVTFHTLLSVGAVSPQRPAWFGTLVLRAVELFPDLDAEEQLRLVQGEWHLIATPALVPVLDRLVIADDTPDRLRAHALRRLHELDPRRGRARILEEIRRPRHRLGQRPRKAVDALAPGLIPELDATLIDQLEDGADMELRMLLIARHGTPELATRVRAQFERGRVWAITILGSFLAYLSRVDPAYAASAITRGIDAIDTRRVYSASLEHAVQLHAPIIRDVEPAAIRLLSDPEVDFAVDAAGLLRDHGSVAAEWALRARLRAWQDEWRECAEELRHQVVGSNASVVEQGRVEHALIDALARGRGWFLDAEALQTLSDDAVSEGAQQHISQLVNMANNPRIYVSLDPGGDVRPTVAQYRLRSLDALEEKLAQFPHGTALSLDIRGHGAQIAEVRSVRARIERSLVQHGLTVR